ncbi:hypothetical protein ACN3XK_71310 [Actinomadura welshii]
MSNFLYMRAAPEPVRQAARTSPGWVEHAAHDVSASPDTDP